MSQTLTALPPRPAESELPGPSSAPDRFVSRVGRERLAYDDSARLERLKQVVELARRAPIYKDRLEGIRIDSLADLARLPLLHKSDLKNNHPDVFLSVGRDKVWHFHESFGTTGLPVCGWYTLDDMEVEIDVIRRWLRHFGPGQTVMNRYPYAFPVPAQLVEAAARLLGGTIIPTSNLTYNVGFPRVLRLMDHMSVNCITAMPLEAVLVKEAALVAGIDPRTAFPNFQGFSFAGRILTPSWKASMEEDWGVAVDNLYGCTEGGPFATSCAQGHLHLHTQAFLFEVLDPQTKESLDLRQAPQGTLTATSLIREAHQVLRYYTQDFVRVLPGDCPCGDPAPRIEVLGRAGGMLSFGGVQVTNFDLEEEILAWSREFRSNVFFVVVTSRGFIVRVEAAEPGRVNAGEGSRRLTDRLGVPVRVEVVPRGVLVNHVSLVASAAVFKPRTVSDFRVEKRKVINLSGGLIDFWAEITPKLMWWATKKWFRDLGTRMRLRLLG